MAQNQGTPPQLPPLIVGQQIRNGPYTVTVTPSMVKQREKENRQLARRWEAEERRRARMAEQDEQYFGDFKEFLIRRRFVRRVFSILTLQLIFTALVIGTFMFVEEARRIMIMYPVIWIVALCTFTVTYLSISCSDCARRQAPCNVISLILLTVSLSYLTAAVSIFYTDEVVLLAVGATTLVTMTIFSIATCTRFDLTKRFGLMLIVGLVGSLGLIGMVIALSFTYIPALHVGIAIVGCLLISMYLFFDLQTIMGGRTIELSPDEVVFATAQIYVDVILLFRYILMCLRFAK